MNKIGRIAASVAAMVLVGAVFPRSAEATFIVDINQVGPNVVITSSGTLNVTGLTLGGPTAGVPEIGASVPTINVGAAAAAGTFYVGITGPSSFGSGALIGGPDTASGDLVGIALGIHLLVPSGYVSGSALSDSMAFDGGTYALMGLTPGTYTWSWGIPGTNFDSFVLDIHPVTESVPEPTTLAVLVAGLLGLGVSRRKAKRAARWSSARRM